MQDAGEYAIVVESLSKRYGDVQAVNGLSFKVRQGEVFAFLGPNGAGKTTTVEIIETIRTPGTGRVSLLGMDVATHKREIVARIGVLPQGFSSFDLITVRESVRYYAQLFGRGRADIDEILGITELHGVGGVQFRHLSGGLKQRLGIAIALVNDPEVVFLDEPTTGLDPHARRAVWDVLLGLRSKGKTVFLTTHAMEEAELLADTVAILSKGQLVAMGTPDELIGRSSRPTSLVFKSPDPRALSAAAGLGFAAAPDGRGRSVVLVKSAEDVRAILSAIHAAGAPLPGLEVRAPNLEQVFLELTGDDLDTAPSPKGDAR